MSYQTLQQIQDQIAFEIDGNASISTSNADWGYRTYPINRALSDWAETNDWEVLKKTFNGLVSTSAGNASIAIPSDFRKMDSFPRIAGTNFPEYVIVDQSTNSKYSAGDNVVNILGNPKDGYTLYVPNQTLVSGASVQFTYYANPVSLVSTGSLTECPDPSFLVQRALYYLYKAREDGRFPEAKVESDRILARMLENESALGRAYQDRSVQSFLGNRRFRIGRD